MSSFNTKKYDWKNKSWPGLQGQSSLKRLQRKILRKKSYVCWGLNLNDCLGRQDTSHSASVTPRMTEMPLFYLILTVLSFFRRILNMTVIPVFYLMLTALLLFRRWSWTWQMKSSTSMLKHCLPSGWKSPRSWYNKTTSTGRRSSLIITTSIEVCAYFLWRVDFPLYLI